MKLKEMPREALQQFYAEAKAEYDACKAKGLKLDMSRGKPEKQQLDLSNALFSLPTPEESMRATMARWTACPPAARFLRNSSA